MILAAILLLRMVVINMPMPGDGFERVVAALVLVTELRRSARGSGYVDSAAAIRIAAVQC